MRYRLIPTRRRRELGLLEFEAERRVQAENVADGYAEGLNQRVLLVEAPVDGLVKEIGVYGPEPEQKVKR